MNGFFRKMPSLVALALVLAVLPGPVLAAEGDPSTPAPDVSTPAVSDSGVTVNVERHDTLSVASVPADSPADPPAPASGSSAPTLSETIRSLFGSYTPRTQTVTTYYDGQPIATEEQVIPGLAGLDYEWLSGVGIFALVLFCLFRLLGGVLRRG